MSQLIDRGLAFYWGTSEWSADQIRDAYGIARREHLVPPTMEQPQYNMFTRERVEKEYARLYDDIGLGLTTFSPLASGNLAGKYLDGVPKGTRLDTEGYEYLRKQLDTPRGRDRIEKVKRLIPIAGELGASMAQLAIAWAVRNPRVSTVITGASRPAQITENMRALELSTRLGPDVLARIEAVLENRPKPETDFRLSN
jgi:aryl-alcohol dehydrogenase-like predicted oxidoreductase